MTLPTARLRQSAHSATPPWDTSTAHGKTTPGFLCGENGPKVHAHVVVGKADGTAHGGHLLEAHVWPTLEVTVTESPVHLRRKSDPETGLALIDLSATRDGGL